MKQWWRRWAAAAGVVTAVLTLPLQAQRANYERADRIRTYDPSLVGGQVRPVFLSDSVRFYYEALGDGADRGTLYLVDARNRSRRPIFDHARVAVSLSDLADTTVDPRRLPARKLVDDERVMQFDLRGRAYWCTLATEACAQADSTRLAAWRRQAPPAWSSRSPNGEWDAFVWNHNVYVRPARLAEQDAPAPSPSRNTPRTGCDVLATAGARFVRDSLPLPSGSIALTTDGVPTFGYGSWKFGLQVAQLEAERFRPLPGDLRWSPDSRRLLVHRDDLRGLRVFPLYSTTSVVPVDHSYFYAVPGDTAIPQFDTYVIDVAGRRAVKVQDAPVGAIQAFSDAVWGRESTDLFLLHSTRGHKSLKVSLVNTVTGVVRTIAQDSGATSLELKSGGGETWAVVNGGEDIFWFSERDDWGHLYRYGKDGVLKNQVERGPYSVGDIVRIDSARKQIYFTAYGRAEGVPYYAHLFRVGFDGSGMTQLTSEPGNHAIRFLPKAPYFIDSYSTISTPPVTVLRAADGRIVMELAEGDTRGLASTGWTPAEVVTVKGRNGATDLWGIMHRPSDFDPSKRYPVIVRVYPGPQIGSVGDWIFKGADSRLGTRDVLPDDAARARVWSGDGMGRSLAELGFIVIQIDAMGTSRRSKSFHDFYYGRMRDNGLPDHVAAVRQLAARHAWMDTTRVGIWGHSGGGFSAAAGMFHFPSVFKVGVSQSGDHDVRSYGWYWGERYQGLYARAGDRDNYEDEANYRYASQLEGKLLLMHGEMDCNVHPVTTMRVVDALIKAGKDFDMLIVPDAGHQLPAYAVKRAWDYFVRHLKGEEPPATYRMLAP